MVQSPSWEVNWFAASQEIPRISLNPNVHYRTHNRPPAVSILSQPNPVHIPTSHLLEIHPNIIHPSTPRSPQWSPSLRFPTKTLYTPLSTPIGATCPAHLILLDFITLTILGKEYKSFSSSLYNLLHSPVMSFLCSVLVRASSITFHSGGTRSFYQSTCFAALNSVLASRKATSLYTFSLLLPFWDNRITSRTLLSKNISSQIMGIDRAYSDKGYSLNTS